MAHKIFGERFLSRKEPAWHKLGEVFSPDLKILASEAVQKVAGDVIVQAFPVFAELPERLDLPNQRAIIRLPTQDAPKHEVLGITSDKWVPDSYVSLAKSLDALSETHLVETAGTLEEGGLCFLSLRGEDWDVQGDINRSYFVLNLSLSPGKGHKIFHSPVRVVCWNTNTMAENSATIHLGIQHSADAKRQITLAADCVRRFKDLQQKTKEIFDAMAKVNVNQDMLDKIFSSAHPEPKPSPRLRLLNTLGTEASEVFKRDLKGTDFEKIVKDQEALENARERRRERLEACAERFEAFEPSNLRGTVYAAYNAVTEVADWRGNGKNADRATMWGNRATEKAKAFSAALEYVAEVVPVKA